MLTKLKNIFTKEVNSGNSENISDQNTGSKPEQNVSSDDTSLILNDQKLKSDEHSSEKIESTDKSDVSVNTEEVKDEVIKVLRTCYDPEIPVDVWELGLIYDIAVACNGDVLIVMTLTSPACPVAGILPGEIEQKVKDHPKVNDCKVQLTFDPPWNLNMMSEVAKLELGFL